MENVGDKEIEEALVTRMDDMAFEKITTEVDSPINEPVKEGEVSTGATQEQRQQLTDQKFDLESSPIPQEKTMAEENIEKESIVEDDAPEQAIDETGESEQQEEADGIEIPHSHAALAADSFLGIANNLLEIGGGFFVKIKKSKEMLDFDSVVQIIDTQNSKNIKRIKLDEDDKALLRPLLIEILKKRAQALTPEQQLIAAVISILVKKVQIMTEIRAENNLLIENIRAAIREEINQAKEEQTEKNQEETFSDDDLPQTEEETIEVIETDGTADSAAT